ncbi:S-adenosyl-L-methionine-dependent methyltransferase [Cantharellus anzutake]|uniref:S-adenosyl-L-methionine-dependent methyltransferase n=1 Tax=Cantharellus anzutake TaxID=1750568 RepID=UPI001905B6EF|nr:S-adenosyl-L-methionine-dependent methyltransferase [Cantharellus anzutake]KAF8339815.1 S-adenosyl-L-methionine-dependent methyltransferase [Cantharellus anzutake]
MITMICNRRLPILHTTTSMEVARPRLRRVPNRCYTTMEHLLVKSIQATGPLQVPRYLQMCLSHPTHGYYMRKEVFGAQGDFTTSPEISQIFGELVGTWFLLPWMKEHKDKSRSIRLIELGPGRGTLMADIIRTFNSFRSTANAIDSVHLVETSEKLRTSQKAKLSSALEGSRNSPKLHWHDRIEDIAPSDAYTMLVANEFFDALPFHIIEKTPDGFKEVLVGLKSNLSSSLAPLPKFKQNQLAEPFSSPSKPQLQLFLSDTVSTTSTLLSASSPRFSKLIGARGAGLIIDYGDEHFFGSSFRGFRNHRIVDVFDQPGHSDLTANVDFAYLKEALLPIARSLGPITQRDFLLGMQFNARLEGLTKQAPLIDPTGMGAQYKVMGIVPQRGEPDRQDGIDELLLYPFNLPRETAQPE